MDGIELVSIGLVLCYHPYYGTVPTEPSRFLYRGKVYFNDYTVATFEIEVESTQRCTLYYIAGVVSLGV